MADDVQVVDIGDWQGSLWHPLPGDFSSAVSLVVTFRVATYWPQEEPEGWIEAPLLRWALWDTIDDTTWNILEDSGGSFSRDLWPGGRLGNTRRFLVPVGMNLLVSGSFNYSFKNERHPHWEECRAEGTVVHILARRL